MALVAIRDEGSVSSAKWIVINNVLIVCTH